MPALPPVPGVVKVHMGMTVGTDTTTGWHIFFGYGPTPPTQTQVDGLAAGLSNQYSTVLNSHASTALSLTSVTVTDLSSSTGKVGTWSGSVAGGQTGPLSASVSMLVNYKIARRYRGGKPRAYIPTGFTGALQNPQQWASTFLSGFQTDLNTFFTNILASIATWNGTSSHVSVSYYTGGTWHQTPSGGYIRVPTPRSGGPLVDLVTARVCNPTIGSQRGRIRSR